MGIVEKRWTRYNDSRREKTEERLLNAFVMRRQFSLLQFSWLRNSARYYGRACYRRVLQKTTTSGRFLEHAILVIPTSAYVMDVIAVNGSLYAREKLAFPPAENHAPSVRLQCSQ